MLVSILAYLEAAAAAARAAAALSASPWTSGPSPGPVIETVEASDGVLSIGAVASLAGGGDGSAGGYPATGPMARGPASSISTPTICRRGPPRG